MPQTGCVLDELPDELPEFPNEFQGSSSEVLFFPSDIPLTKPTQPVITPEPPTLSLCIDPHNSGLNVIWSILWAFWLITIDPTVMPDPSEINDFLAWLNSPDSRIEWMDPVHGVTVSDCLIPATLTDGLQTIIRKTFNEHDAKFIHRFLDPPGRFAGDRRNRLVDDFYTFLFEHVLVSAHVDHLTNHSLGCLCRCICTIASQGYCIDQVPRDLIMAFCIHSDDTEMLGKVIRHWVSGAPIDI